MNKNIEQHWKKFRDELVEIEEKRNKKKAEDIMYRGPFTEFIDLLENAYKKGYSDANSNNDE